jgi:hypothetical protein
VPPIQPIAAPGETELLLELPPPGLLEHVGRIKNNATNEKTDITLFLIFSLRKDIFFILSYKELVKY